MDDCRNMVNYLLVALLLASLLLSSCSLTTSVHMKCKGECDFETNREVQTTPDIPLPKEK